MSHQESLAQPQSSVELSLFEYAHTAAIALEEAGDRLTYPQQYIQGAQEVARELIGVGASKSISLAEPAPSPGELVDHVRTLPGAPQKWMWEDGIPEKWSKRDPETGNYTDDDGTVPASFIQTVHSLLQYDTYYLDRSTHERQRQEDVPKPNPLEAKIIKDALEKQLENRHTMPEPDVLAIESTLAWVGEFMPKPSVIDRARQAALVPSVGVFAAFVAWQAR